MRQTVYFVPANGRITPRSVLVLRLSETKLTANGFIFNARKLQSEAGYLGKNIAGQYWASPAAYYRYVTRPHWYTRAWDALFSFIEA
jgi:hypothetical protein